MHETTFIEQETKDRVDPDTSLHHNRKRTWRSFFCTRLSKGLITALLVALIVPTLAYIFVISRNVPSGSDDDDSDQYVCLILEEYRLPCGRVNISEKECLNVNCCFNTTTGQCHHYLPSKYFYRVSSDGSYVASQNQTPVGTDTLKNVGLTVQKKTSNKLSLIVHNPLEKFIQDISLEDTFYSVNVSASKLLVQVTIKESNVTVFSSSQGALVASEDYWEWSFQLSNGTLFGLDRNHIQLKGNETLTKVVYKSKRDHYTLPVFWGYTDKKFFGVVIKNDGPLEVRVSASNMVSLKSLAGQSFEVELTLGDTPSDLYKNQVGDVEPPPLWVMGTHNCRKGDSTLLNEILEVYLANNNSAFDTDCIHENIFMALQNSSKLDSDVTNLNTIISESGRKFLLSLPPHILVDASNPLYIYTKDLDMLYKNQSGSVHTGIYLGQKVAFVDYYSHENATDYMAYLIKWLNDVLPVDSISGFVLNDNWPQDDSSELIANTENLPYFTSEMAAQMQYTLPWNSKGSDHVLHLKKHNMYGATQKTLLLNYLLHSSPEAHPLVVSSARVYGDAEPEIADNLDTSWDNFNLYLNRILFSSITGNSMVGLPICGDTSNYNKSLHETLCIRWYIAAASLPYFRVSSGDIFRDPANLNTQYASKITEEVMVKRAMFIDYFNTILNVSEPIVRPMYYDYYSNTTTFSMERQYTIGRDLIVAHPFGSFQTKLQAYLPYSRGVWYEFWGGTMFVPSKSNEYVQVDTFDFDWTMFVAQGTIIALTDSTGIVLHIALDCSSKTCKAEGVLLKDNIDFKFEAEDHTLTVTLSETINETKLSYAKLYGYKNSTYGYSFTCTTSEAIGELETVTELTCV